MLPHNCVLLISDELQVVSFFEKRMHKGLQPEMQV
ncbi:unnamed protein product [Rhodiola kirilowii]